MHLELTPGMIALGVFTFDYSFCVRDWSNSDAYQAES